MKNSRFLYQMVYEEIKSDIINGILAPATKICSEKQLSLKYGLSTITVKTALGLLTEEGLVRRVPGKGTFVAEPVKSLAPLNKGQTEGTENQLIIGVVFEHVSSPFGLDMMYHMDRIAMEKGYRLCIRFSYTDQERETEEINFLLSLGVCGLIIMPSHGDHYNTKILKLVIDGFPVVLIDKSLNGIPVPAVYTDNDQCARMLISHLVDRGYKDIGLISSPSNGISSIKGRRKGFYEGIAAHSLIVHEECIVKLKVDAICVTGKLMAEQNAKIISSYLSDHPALDSLVCLESGFLPDIYEACQRLGLRIPEDIAVCSFDEDNSSSTGYFFTHVKQDEIAIAEKAMELIDCMLSKKSGEIIMNYKIPGIFREGKTTKERSKKEHK
jgi:GntR family transcriptional regulator, arabinose operon transcriptional repressor